MTKVHSHSRILAGVALFTILITATGCFGPKPIVRSFETQFPQFGSGQPAKIDAVVANTGPGSGQVEVTVSLTNKLTGETLRKDSTNLDLNNGESTHVLFELDLPPAANNLRAEDIEVVVEAHYPIQ